MEIQRDSTENLWLSVFDVAEPVIIEESDESKAGSYKEEVGDVYSDGEMYTPNAAGFVRGESDDYTSEDADEEEEEEEEEDEPDSGEQGIVSTEGSEGSSDALNGSYKLPGGNQVASHATKAKATASLPIGISQGKYLCKHSATCHRLVMLSIVYLHSSVSDRDVCSIKNNGWLRLC